MEPELPDEIEELLTAIRKWKEKKHTFRSVDLVGAMLLPAPIILLLFGVFGIESSMLWVVPSAMLLASLIQSLALRKAKRRLEATEEMLGKKVESLCNSQDGRAVPLILEASVFFYPEARKKYMARLFPLLSLVREEHAYLYTEQNRAQLYRPLREYSYYSRAEYAALLQAIGLVGDSSGVSLLEKFLATPPRNTAFKELRPAVQEALATLNARLERERTGESLLRASVAPVAAPETLLRPASYAETTEPQQLLRASTAEKK